MSLYFKQPPKATESSTAVEFSEDEYEAHVKENVRAFKEASKRSR